MEYEGAGSAKGLKDSLYLRGLLEKVEEAQRAQKELEEGESMERPIFQMVRTGTLHFHGEKLMVSDLDVARFIKDNISLGRVEAQLEVTITLLPQTTISLSQDLNGVYAEEGEQDVPAVKEAKTK